MKIAFVVALVGLAVGLSCGQSLSHPGDQGTGGHGGSTGTGGYLGGDGGFATSGSGGGGGIGGAGGCQSPRYDSAGCDVAPRCPSGFGGACADYACSCSGKVIGGCANEFGEPYAYTIPMSLGDGGVPRLSSIDAGPIHEDAGYTWVGVTCDPNAVP